MSSTRSISRHVPAVFAAVMVLFICALAWSGWTLIQQDSDLADQRKRDLVDAAATEAAATLTERIAEEQQRLGRFLSGEVPAPDSSRRVVLMMRDGAVRAYPDSALRYYPGEVVSEPADSRLLEADRLEFGQRALDRAASLLGGLSSAGSATRAGALVRLARIRRKQGRTGEAFDLYRQLARTTGASIAGVPAELIGLFGLCEMLASQPRLLGEAAADLGRALARGGHPVTKSTYEFYARAVMDWASAARTSSPEIASLGRPHIPSEAASRLHEIETGWREGSEPPGGLRSIQIDSTLALLQWSASEGRFAGSSGDAVVIQNQWLRPLQTEFEAAGLGLAITDDSGNRLYASGEPSDAIRAVRTLASAGQSWTLASYITESAAISTANRDRRRILLATLLLVMAIVVTSTYFLSRTMRRESAIAQLQSDFVSAVSHEFRTPLTSMRQIAELLMSGRVPSDERKQEYYADLDKESRRLSRLVESLLNFGRMEAGGYPYSFEPVAVAALVQDTIAEFSSEMSLSSEGVKLTADANSTCVLDRETFKLALWNLLDNALKYSGPQPDIRVALAVRGPTAVFSVSDRGPGIPVADQTRIFDKFVRGSDDRLDGVRGTGLGLALVRTIASDHGGKVELESAPGAGSTFSLILPTHEDS